ncbi:DNA-3-methyladenine glycosylase I [Patescibacteria group bacterium]
MKSRCQWGESEQMRKYHDTEWGVPIHDDRKLFEFLILEGAQAGLSWATILKRRNGYKEAFARFNPIKVAKFTKTDIERLLNNEKIIRNRSKIEAAIQNAKQFLGVQKEYGSFDTYIWSFVNNKPIINSFKEMSDLPTTTSLSELISKDMKARGFKFVGPTIMYAHMQATGMVNDHVVNCFRYDQV